MKYISLIAIAALVTNTQATVLNQISMTDKDSKKAWGCCPFNVCSDYCNCGCSYGRDSSERAINRVEDLVDGLKRDAEERAHAKKMNDRVEKAIEDLKKTMEE